jgi:tetratricopeptide (TPR) repeat protein
MVFPALAQGQQLETSGTQSPAISASGNVAITYGLTPEQVQQLTKAAAAGAVGPLAGKIVDLSQKLGITQGAALTLLRVLGQQDVPLEQLPQKLAEVTAQYKQAVDRLAALQPEDPITQGLVGRAEAAIKGGHLDEADQLLSQAEQADVAAAHQAQQLAQQAQAAADRRLLHAADARGARGDIAMTELGYLEAAQHFQDAVDLVPPGHPDEKARFLLAEGEALWRQGDERGNNDALVKAIATYHLALQENSRERVPLDWAKTQMNLGVALETLGERESRTAHL